MKDEEIVPDLDTILCHSENQVSSEMDGEYVMMNIEEGSYFGADTIGGRIWELLQEPRSVKDICDVLMKEYLVQREECEVDVLDFVKALFSEGLLRIVST